MTARSPIKAFKDCSSNIDLMSMSVGFIGVLRVCAHSLNSLP